MGGTRGRPAATHPEHGPLADYADQFTQGFASATGVGLINDPDAVRAV
ncbi:hypothetical protein [Micromonospora sp. KC207]|nr:hypothetical protein [Micromonospora sp. KC207]